MTEVPLPHITQPQPQTSYCTPKTDPHRFLGVSSRLWCIRVAVPLVYCGVKCASLALLSVICLLPISLFSDIYSVNSLLLQHMQQSVVWTGGSAVLGYHSQRLRLHALDTGKMVNICVHT